MKHEILFRGKRSNGKWVYGSLVVSENIAPAIYYEVGNGLVKQLDWCYISPESIGQYTGLKDKNGVKIFEGDIIKTPRGSIGEVVFGRAEEECTHREYRRKITDVYTTYGWIFKRADGFTIAIDDEILQGELIGNVTDNPELMK
jgi:hypothetical protein